jgi:hypothetical protein
VLVTESAWQIFQLQATVLAAKSTKQRLTCHHLPGQPPIIRHLHASINHNLLKPHPRKVFAQQAALAGAALAAAAAAAAATAAGACFDVAAEANAAPEGLCC